MKKKPKIKKYSIGGSIAANEKPVNVTVPLEYNTIPQGSMLQPYTNSDKAGNMFYYNVYQGKHIPATQNTYKGDSTNTNPYYRGSSVSFANGGTLPKFTNGDIFTPQNYNQPIANNNSGVYSDGYANGQTYTPEEQQSGNKMGASGYAAIGSAAVGSGVGIANTYNNTNATDADKGQAISDGVYGTGTAVVSAMNPVLGGLMGAVGGFGKKQKMANEQVDENGNLVNRNKAIAGHAVGTFTNPSRTLSNVMTNKNASTERKIFAGLTGGMSENAYGSKYADQIEADAKADIAAQNQYPMGGIAGIPNAEGVIHAPELGGYFRKRRK